MALMMNAFKLAFLWAVCAAFSVCGQSNMYRGNFIGGGALNLGGSYGLPLGNITPPAAGGAGMIVSNGATGLVLAPSPTGGGGGGGGATNAVSTISSNGIPIATGVTTLNFTNPISIASNNGVATVVLSGSGGAGWSNTASATAPLVATTNSSAGATNVALSLSANPQYFKTNSSGQLDFIVQNQSVDTRPLSDADLKGVVPASNTLIVIFTNNSPCTIQKIRIDLYGIISSSNPYLLPTLSIFQNGISNGCQLPMFYAGAGFPSMAYHGDSIDIQEAPATFGHLCCDRKVAINCESNSSVAITFPTNDFILWSDVYYRVGTPVVSNTWHMVESQQTTPNNTTYSIASASGKIGQIESLTMFTLSTGIGQGYLESRPTIYLDGLNPVLANGTEDFFGGSSYWFGGNQAYGTPFWGNESQNFLSYKYGFTDGNCSYVFFQNAFFNSSFVFNYTNTSGVSLSNDFLITYWTIP